MTEQSRALTASVVGAVMGGLLGYVLFTDRGRRWRQRFEIALEDFAREISSLEGTVQKAAVTANQGWRAVSSTINRGSQTPDSNVH